jgi:hypothetical protein
VLEERVRRPAHEGDCLVAREAGDVGQPGGVPVSESAEPPEQEYDRGSRRALEALRVRGCGTPALGLDLVPPGYGRLPRPHSQSLRTDTFSGPNRVLREPLGR